MDEGRFVPFDFHIISGPPISYPKLKENIGFAWLILKYFRESGGFFDVGSQGRYLQSTVRHVTYIDLVILSQQLVFGYFKSVILSQVIIFFKYIFCFIKTIDSFAFVQNQSAAAFVRHFFRHQ